MKTNIIVFKNLVIKIQARGYNAVRTVLFFTGNRKIQKKNPFLLHLITLYNFLLKIRDKERERVHRIGIRANVVYGWSLLCLSVGGLSSMGNLNGSHDNKVPRKNMRIHFVNVNENFS